MVPGDATSVVETRSTPTLTPSGGQTRFLPRSHGIGPDLLGRSPPQRPARPRPRRPRPLAADSRAGHATQPIRTRRSAHQGPRRARRTARRPGPHLPHAGRAAAAPAPAARPRRTHRRRRRCPATRGDHSTGADGAIVAASDVLAIVRAVTPVPAARRHDARPAWHQHRTSGRGGYRHQRAGLQRHRRRPPDGPAPATPPGRDRRPARRARPTRIRSGPRSPSSIYPTTLHDRSTTAR